MLLLVVLGVLHIETCDVDECSSWDSSLVNINIHVVDPVDTSFSQLGRVVRVSPSLIHPSPKQTNKLVLLIASACMWVYFVIYSPSVRMLAYPL